jgi:hypothetical protein
MQRLTQPLAIDSSRRPFAESEKPGPQTRKHTEVACWLGDFVEEPPNSWESAWIDLGGEG